MANTEHLQATQCALLVVDIQERLMPVIDEQERVTGNTVLLLKAAAVLGMPVLATTQYAQRIGPLLAPVTAALNGAPVYDKMEFDCFANPAFQQAVRQLDRRIQTLIVCGVESHICVYQTVVGGLAAGYHVWVAADAVSSRTPANYANGLARIRELGGTVAATEMIIYDLLQRAGTAEFKALLPHLK